jgi:hypothetical protein
MPMRATRVQDADGPGRVTKCDEPLAEELQLYWSTTRARKLARKQCWEPEPPEELAHRRAGVGPGEKFVVGDT